MRQGLFYILIFTGLQSFAQDYQLFTHRTDTINNWEDYLFVDNLDFDSLILETDNGEIGRLDSNRFTIRHTRSGKTSVKSTFYRLGATKASVDTFKVVDVDMYCARLSCPISSKTVSRPVMTACVGIVGKFSFDCACDINFNVNTFRIEIIRDGKAIFKNTSNEAKFTSSIKQTFYKLENGDLIRFKDIFLIGLDGQLKKVDDLEYEIKN